VWPRWRYLNLGGCVLGGGGCAQTSAFRFSAFQTLLLSTFQDGVFIMKLRWLTPDHPRALPGPTPSASTHLIGRVGSVCSFHKNFLHLSPPKKSRKAEHPQSQESCRGALWPRPHPGCLVLHSQGLPGLPQALSAILPSTA
jgi:hypothetical protein